MVPGWHAVAFLCLLAIKAYAEPSDDIIGNTRPIDSETSGELGESKDVYIDSRVLSYLQTGELTTGLTTKDKDRILQRAKRFKWEGSHLLRIWKDGKVRIVPLPTE